MAASKALVHTLTIFLLKEEFSTIGEALKTTKGVERCVVKIGNTTIGDLAIKKNRSRSPKWLRLFEEATELTLPSILNASTAAVLFIKRKRRLFALSFGQGRHLLAPGCYEEQFGLRVTLNSVDPTRLRSVDRKTFDAISSHSRIQTSQAAEIPAFGINVEQDLLCAVTGTPIDKASGRLMTGMDSLTVNVPATLSRLPGLLDIYFARFTDVGYKESFPWIDHIGEVRDPILRERLDAALVEKLRTESLPEMRAWLCVPALIDWARVGGLTYREGSSDLKQDLHLRDFFESVRERREISLELLKRRRAYAMEADGDRSAYDWPIYECLYCELDLDETAYLLTGSKWYRVDRDFVAGVDQAVKKLVRPRPLPLPSYDDASEGVYNERAAKMKPNYFALLDRKLIRIGGTTIEACDLFGVKNEFVHVKRYGGSSVLSHLFAQGSVAGQAFLQDEEFRVAFNALLPRARRLRDAKARPNPSNYEVVYAIVSQSKKTIEGELPFFSRLNLRTAAKQLQGFGYRVSLVKISVEEA